MITAVRLIKRCLRITSRDLLELYIIPNYERVYLLKPNETEELYKIVREHFNNKN